MLTHLVLGRSALLQATTLGLLALALALSVGLGAALIADREEATGAIVGALALDEATLRELAAALKALDAEQLETASPVPMSEIGAAIEAREPVAPIPLVAVVEPETEPSEEMLALRASLDIDWDEAALGDYYFDLDAVRASEAIALARSVATSAPAASSFGETPELLPGDRVRATVSFYYCEHDVASINPPGDGGLFCGAMRDGTIVYPGAAACDYEYLGQRFRILSDPLQREYICHDTGSAVGGLHRDIWFYTSDEGWDWLWLTGSVATIEVLP